MPSFFPNFIFWSNSSSCYFTQAVSVTSTSIRVQQNNMKMRKQHGNENWKSRMSLENNLSGIESIWDSSLFFFSFLLSPRLLWVVTCDWLSFGYYRLSVLHQMRKYYCHENIMVDIFILSEFTHTFGSHFSSTELLIHWTITTLAVEKLSNYSWNWQHRFDELVKETWNFKIKPNCNRMRKSKLTSSIFSIFLHLPFSTTAASCHWITSKGMGNGKSFSENWMAKRARKICEWNWIIFMVTEEWKF